MPLDGGLHGHRTLGCLTFAVLTATSLFAGGANFLLASQTVVGANFRVFVFGIKDAVALIR